MLAMDRELMSLVLEKGHSRVPVYYEHSTNIIGLVLVIIFLQLKPTSFTIVSNWLMLGDMTGFLVNHANGCMNH